MKNKKLNKDKLFSALNKGFFNFNFDIKYLQIIIWEMSKKCGQFNFSEMFSGISLQKSYFLNKYYLHNIVT